MYRFHQAVSHNHCSPFPEGIFQIGGHEAGMKLSSVFGIINACGEHLTQVSREGSQVVGQVCVEILVEEHQVYEAVV